MTGGALSEALFIAMLIALNHVFAMAEIAIVSARRPRLQERAEAGDDRAAVAMKLGDEPNRFLSTVQIAITLIDMLTGVFTGMTLATVLARTIATVFPDLAGASSAIAGTSMVLLISFFSLIFGELTPKRIALNNTEEIACAVAKPMNFLSKVARPVVRLLSFFTDMVLRIMGFKPSEEPPVTEEEIKIMIGQGTEAGVFDAAEQDMVENVFRLGDRRVSTLMTPRPEIVWIDIDDADEVNWQKIASSNHANLPVCRDNLDEVIGIASAKELFSQVAGGQNPVLKKSLIEPVYVPETAQALKVLELLKNTGTDIALVVDEYGGTQGLVTLMDVLEAIVGDLPSQEVQEPAAIQRDDESWLLDGMLTIDELKEKLDIRDLPGENMNYETLGGFVMTTMGHIPTSSEHFEWGGFRFEVVDMDGFRVDKVMASPVHPPEAKAQPEETAVEQEEQAPANDEEPGEDD